MSGAAQPFDMLPIFDNNFLQACNDWAVNFLDTASRRSGCTSVERQVSEALQSYVPPPTFGLWGAKTPSGLPLRMTQISL